MWIRGSLTSFAITRFIWMGQLIIFIDYEVVNNVRTNRSFNNYRINVVYAQCVILNYLNDVISVVNDSHYIQLFILNIIYFRRIPNPFILDQLNNPPIWTIFWVLYVKYLVSLCRKDDWFNGEQKMRRVD